ncbi:MAG: DUF4268 domain-containing protein [Cytophagales bacterium]|nr:DUF4268 domain-containing protein [Cytophagales bacterium]
MSKTKLGQLKKINDLKDVWDHETTSFTPWLAQEENIALLAEAIGIEELVVEAQEKAVGPFRADILCKDPGTDTYVLIENQLEKTDHTHLGQILTYAAGLGACTIIWIAKKFTNEHRAALDWLNEITDERFHFFGLEVELWQIGDSAIAPNFNIACKPNDWTRRVQEAAKVVEEASLTPRDLLLRDFWTELRQDIELHKCKVHTQKPLPQSWTNAALGRSNIWLVAVARVQKRSLGIHVAMTGANRFGFFAQLEQDKTVIEAEIGHSLEWLKMDDGKQESHIRLSNLDVDLNNRTLWPQHIQWMRENLEAFHKAFSGRVRALSISLAE